MHGDEEGQTRRTNKTLRKFACEGEERWEWEEGPREVRLIEEEGPRAYSKAEVERERLGFKRETSYSWTTVPEKEAGHRVQSTGIRPSRDTGGGGEKV